MLNERARAKDFSGMVRGRVLDEHGQAMEDAVIEPEGLQVGAASMYGAIEGLEPLAVSDRHGNFELAYAKPTPKMLLRVEARAMAPRLIAMSTGSERHVVRVEDGAAITGCLLANGRPLGGAEIGVYPKHHGGFGSQLKVSGDPYEEVRVGTKADGTFSVTNLPDVREWYVYAKMASLTEGATQPVEVAIAKEDTFVRVPDLMVGRAYRLRGVLTTSDHTKIVAGTRILLSSEKLWDFQTATTAADGHFDLAKLPAGDYTLSPAVKGCAVQPGSSGAAVMTIRVNGDRNDVAVEVSPNTAK